MTVEMLTELGTRTIMAQKYIPAIVHGDKRVLVIDGKPVPFALARIPQAGEVRGNLAAGGMGRAQPISEREAFGFVTFLFIAGLDTVFATRNNVGLARANLHGILTERGDLAEALAIGREFVGPARDVGALWIVIDHFALRLAKSGRYADAARVSGWNDAVVRAKDVRRQINEQRAYESTQAILRANLSAAELERLLAEGAKLSEDEVSRLATEG